MTKKTVITREIDMRQILLIALMCFLVLFTNALLAQKGYNYKNDVYLGGIKSVQTTVNNSIESIPVLRVGSTDDFILTFDDLNEDESSEYAYKLIHCTRDWQPSGIMEIDYINGYNNEPLRKWEFSNSTLTMYTHYWLQIPNRDTKIKISGNYLLLIYDRGHQDKPVITRRFLVTEQKVSILAQFLRPTNVVDLQFKQQFALKIDMRDYPIQNPMRDVHTTIVQNGDWGNALEGTKPMFISNTVLTYNAFGTLLFNGNQEFRSFDLRSLRGRGMGVKDIVRTKDAIEVVLFDQRPRQNVLYSLIPDFNGKFYIDNRDRPAFNQRIGNSTSSVDSIRSSFAESFNYKDNGYELIEKNINSDYCYVSFKYSDPSYDGNVYLFGEFTNWELQPQYLMNYDIDKKDYTSRIQLKQGYYDYYFATMDKNKKADFSKTEGTWQDTENDYMFLVYQSDFTTRYDRLIATKRVNSFTDGANRR